MQKDQPSRTAYKVALSVITLGAKPGMDKILPPGIVETTEELLLASGAVGSRTLQWARSKQMVFVYEAFDWMLPGQFEAFAHRKAFCERQVREGMSEGASQILVLGAGYDTMGWRLAPEFPDVNFFEIDHPATARLKMRGVEAMGQRVNLFLIAKDLGACKLKDVLQTNELWDQRARTAIVAEGLVMYLSPEAVRDLFCQCAFVVGAGSRIAFSYIPSGEDDRPDAGQWTGLMLWLQKVAGEPWVWSIRPQELSSFLEKTGWTHTPEVPGTAQKHGVEFYAAAIK